jgi:hypothetical protein
LRALDGAFRKLCDARNARRRGHVPRRNRSRSSASPSS